MAIQNYMTNYNGLPNGNGVVGGELDTIVAETWAPRGHGAPVSFLQSPPIPILASDGAGSTYLLFKNMPGSAILAQLLAEVTAMSGLTSVSIGIYNAATGAAITPNALLNAADWHVGSTKLAPFDAAAALAQGATLTDVTTLAGLTTANPSTDLGVYDIVLTANNAPVQAGTITVRGLLMMGV